MRLPIHVDLSELVRNPVRSGIQRVEREAIRNWPDRAELRPVIVDRAGRIAHLPCSVFDVLLAEHAGGGAALEAERLALDGFVASSSTLHDADVSSLLNLELYFDPVRADAHLRLAAAGVQIAWYVYDFLPFLRPDLFPPGTTRHCMHFLRGLRSAGDRLAFLSEATRDHCATRVLRRGAPEGGWPVLHPGADGLGLERQSFSAKRRDFVAIGTVEPRKNPDALLDAFALLWNRGLDARLVLVGRISPDATRARDFIGRHRGEPRLTVLEQPPDKALRAALRDARAVIMPSEAEGFGLPPYEALFAGIPVIASATLPSAAYMSAGAALLPRMDAPTIATAVVELMDDTVAVRQWTEAALLNLPSWRDFGKDLAEWARMA